MTEKIYILLPVYNRREITRRFVGCLEAQTNQNYHLVLIDDGSTDGTEEMVRSRINNPTVLRGRGDWWWAGALHQGFLWLIEQRAEIEDFVLIINDDTEFEPDFLEQGAAILKEACHTLLLAQCFSKKTGKLFDAGVHADWKSLTFDQASSPDEINCLSTRGLVMRVGDFLDIGGFYPHILPHYASDYEFTIRAHRKGFRLTTDPRLRLWLDETTTGYHAADSSSLPLSFKKMFSLKSSLNPFIWMIFIGLSCPWRWKLKNLLKIWVVVFHSFYLSHRKVLGSK